MLAVMTLTSSIESTFAMPETWRCLPSCQGKTSHTICHKPGNTKTWKSFGRYHLLPTTKPLSANSWRQAAFLQASQILDKATQFQDTFSKECTDHWHPRLACYVLALPCWIPELWKNLEKDYPQVKVNSMWEKCADTRNARAGFDWILAYARWSDLSGFATRSIYTGFLRCMPLQKTHVKEQKIGFIFPSKMQKKPFFRSSYRRSMESHQRCFLHVASWEVVASLAAVAWHCPHSRHIAKNKKGLVNGPWTWSFLIRVCAIFPDGMKFTKRAAKFSLLF